MNGLDRTWFVEQYDAAVRASGTGGNEVDKSRDAVADAYEVGVESDAFPRWETSLREEGRALFDRIVKPVREQRKAAIRRDAEFLVAALRGETVFGELDPTLDQAFPLGDGRDKTLRLWWVDDWQNAAMERYRNAAAATEAARQFDLSAQAIIAAMRRRNAETTGELFR